MEHNPITTGDIAMSMADHSGYRVRSLEKRVAELEAQLGMVFAWSEEIADAVNKLAEYINYGDK